MKIQTTQISRPPRLVGAILLAAAAYVVAPRPAVAQGDTDFEVKIPDRPGTEFAVSRVSVLMTLDVDVADAAEVVTFEITNPEGTIVTIDSAKDGAADGDAFGNLDACSVEPPDYGTLAADDPARFVYELFIHPLSNFDFSDCLDDLTADEEWTVTITSGQTVDGACLRSFQKDPASGCGVDEIVIDSTDPTEVATIRFDGVFEARACGDSRPPVDVVLVLDTSGSMDNSTLGAGARPKFSVLRDAVDDFVADWEFFDVSGDRIGLVFFDTDETVAVSLGDFASESGNVTAAVASECGGSTPPDCSGSTSIGDGLEAAVDLFDFANDHRRAILVMSDGKENTPTRIAFDDVTDPSEVLLYETDPTDTSDLLGSGEDLAIYSVTVGTGTAVKADNTEDLARATGGYYVNTEGDAEPLRSFFLGFLQNFVRFDSWQTLRMVSDEVQRSSRDDVGPRGVYRTTVPVTGPTTRIAFNLLWNDDLASLSLVVTPPDGRPIRRTGEGAARVLLNLPLEDMTSPMGDWEVAVVLGGSNLKSVPFDLVVLADDHALDASFAVAGEDYEPGDVIRLEARLSEFGRPVTGLDADPGATVVARLVAPGETIGDLLSGSTASAEQPAPTDPLTPADAKLHNHLAELPADLTFTEDTIPLRDDGDGPDARAGDGVYTGAHVAPEPGHYNFLFAVEGPGVDLQRFSRQELRTVHVRSVPDADEVTLATTVQTTDDGNQLVIDMTPRTASGSRMGPGWRNFFWFVPDGGEPFRARDNLDGTYTARLRFTGETPAVSLHFVRTSVNLTDDVSAGELPVPLGGGTELLADVVSPFRPWSVSVHVGGNAPAGDTADYLDAGFSGGLDLEYLLNQTIALEAFLGYDQFAGKDAADDVDALHASLNAKAYFQRGRWLGFVVAGGGVYAFDPGSSVGGAAAGAGVQRALGPRLAVELTFKYHSASTSPDRFTFSNLQLGARYRF